MFPVFNLFFKKIFIYLAAPGLNFVTWDLLVVACGIFSCGTRILSCGMWDLVPRPGIEPGPPALGAQSLSHWTAREVPSLCFRHLMHISFLKINRLFFRPVLGLQRN